MELLILNQQQRSFGMRLIFGGSLAAMLSIAPISMAKAELFVPSYGQTASAWMRVITKIAQRNNLDETSAKTASRYAGAWIYQYLCGGKASDVPRVDQYGMISVALGGFVESNLPAAFYGIVGYLMTQESERISPTSSVCRFAQEIANQ
jgi:hypothetical protein